MRPEMRGVCTHTVWRTTCVARLARCLPPQIGIMKPLPFARRCEVGERGKPVQSRIDGLVLPLR